MSEVQDRNSKPSPEMRELIFLFILGAVFMFIIQTGYAFKFGDNYTRLINLNETSALAPFISEELPDVSYGAPHDGQFFYLIARFPLGNKEFTEKLDHLAFRYRRWLYPLVAGGAGTFSPRATLWGLILLNAFSVGASYVLFYLLISRYGLGPFWVLGLAISPGMMASAKILTGDNMAFALALLGLNLFLDKRHTFALIVFALAGLTKEVYLLFPLSLALYSFVMQRDIKTVFLYSVLPAIPLFLWLVTYSRLNPTDVGSFSTWGNLSLPFQGIFQAMPLWLEEKELQRAIFPAVTLGSLVAGVLLILVDGKNRPLLTCLMLPWILMAFVLSGWIWQPGTNAVRGFLPLHAFLVAWVGLLATKNKQALSVKA